MKVKTNYDTVTFVSEIPAEDLQKIQRFCPEALILKKNSEPVFAFAYNDEGSVNSNGIVFENKVDNEVFITIQGGSVPTKEELINTFGDVIFKANVLEQQIQSALAEIEEMVAEVEDSIE